MNRLLKIARTGTPCLDVQFRKCAYGSNGIRAFLRDVMALANAPVTGPRYIVVGVDFDDSGSRTLQEIPDDDFNGKPSYHSMVTEYIEPPIRVQYQPLSVEGKRIGIFEISDAQDRPYMLRVDYSEKLRRGDAYIRVKDDPIKMGRRQLQDMFELKFRDSVSADRIEIGFPGEIIHKDLKVAITNLREMPSAIAGSKLREMVEVQSSSQNSGSTTVMARLTHARLFGSDNPYEDRTPSMLLREMNEVQRKHQSDDEYFLFEKNMQKIQLVVFNQGDEPIQDASLSLVMPNHNDFYVARQLPGVYRNGEYVARSAEEQAEYPRVNLKDDTVHVSNTMGELPVNSPVNVFDVPLRVCVGATLKGRKLGIRYSLFGSNLRTPVKGKLRLIF